MTWDDVERLRQSGMAAQERRDGGQENAYVVVREPATFIALCDALLAARPVLDAIREYDDDTFVINPDGETWSVRDDWCEAVVEAMNSYAADPRRVEDRRET